MGTVVANEAAILTEKLKQMDDQGLSRYISTIVIILFEEQAVKKDSAYDMHMVEPGAENVMILMRAF